MKLKFKVTAKRGTKTVSETTGHDDVAVDKFTVGDMVNRVTETEQFLNKLTGLEWSIEQIL